MQSVVKIFSTADDIPLPDHPSLTQAADIVPVFSTSFPAAAVM